jgi:hypothetical protein
MSEHGPWWDEEEDFMQAVIRKAVLLGFTAEQYTLSEASYVTGEHGTYWRFTHGGRVRSQYSSLYSAAYEFMRLNDYLPLLGEMYYRGNNKDI